MIRGMNVSMYGRVLGAVLGGALAFGACADVVLPQKYTQLEWIESDGEQYIDTRYIPTAASRVVCEFEAPAKQAHPWPAVFGARSCQQGMYANELSFFTHSNRAEVPSFVACGEHVKGTRPFTYGTRVQLSCGANGEASWKAGAAGTDGLGTTAREARACLSPLFLFCQGHSEAPYGHEINSTSRSCLRLYSFRVFEGGKIVCDFRPCRDPEGEAGLYDVARQVFYGNIGKGAFKGSDGVAKAVGGPRDIAMLAGEKWWGAANGLGAKMPLDAKSRIVIDLLRRSYRNQYASLLVSNLGRVIWCEKQCRFEIANGRIKVVPLDNARVFLSHPGKTLREAFLFASRSYFPPSGKTPDELLISAPQYALWIEFTYGGNEEQVLEYAQSMIDNGLPPGVLLFDCMWQAHYGDWRFDPGRFRDPKGMCEKLRKMGYTVILWVCPWVGLDTAQFRLLTRGYDPFRAGRFPTGGFALSADGRSVYPSRWWDGYSALLDFTHPNGHRWFKEQLDRLVADYGVKGFKVDGGELTYYVGEPRFREPWPTAELANALQRYALLYPTCEYRNSWKSGGVPIEVRLGDKGHNWRDLNALIPEMTAGGLLGYSFICPDMVGGGEYTTFLPGRSFDHELFIRSLQVHALCGLMQFSASPWKRLTADECQIVRDTIKMRQEKFATRFVQLARECGKTGEPMIRLMEYQFPGNGWTDVKDQFVMGDFLIVAPQLKKGATSRTVVIPPGAWVSDRGEKFVGPTTITVETPLSRLPYFTRLDK